MMTGGREIKINTKIKVPATSANLGSGFDCLGIALNIYNEVNIEETGSGKIDVKWANEAVVRDEKNLVYTAFSRTLDMLDFTHQGVTINMLNQAIPVGKGLGSSAASVVAGVLGANQIAGKPLSFEEIINVATEIEGHPDNVVPALVGGMTVAVQDKGQVAYSKVSIPGSLRFVALIPRFTLRTSAARQALPGTYSREDLVFNLSRTAMLVASMQNSEFHNLRMATEDRIHQPFRMRFMPGAGEIFDELKQAGSLAEFISGAGPAIMAMADGDSAAESLQCKIEAFLEGITLKKEAGPSGFSPDVKQDLHRQWTTMVLKPALYGAAVSRASG